MRDQELSSEYQQRYHKTCQSVGGQQGLCSKFREGLRIEEEPIGVSCAGSMSCETASEYPFTEIEIGRSGSSHGRW
jgi:hypothetical protein